MRKQLISFAQVIKFCKISSSRGCLTPNLTLAYALDQVHPIVSVARHQILELLPYCPFWLCDAMHRHKRQSCRRQSKPIQAWSVSRRRATRGRMSIAFAKPGTCAYKTRYLPKYIPIQGTNAVRF